MSNYSEIISKIECGEITTHNELALQASGLSQTMYSAMLDYLMSKSNETQLPESWGTFDVVAKVNGAIEHLYSIKWNPVTKNWDTINER